MENKTLNNLKALGTNPKTRNSILITGGVIIGAIALAYMNSDTKNQRPADLSANVNIGKAPDVKSIPGTSDSAKHNELVREENKKAADEAIKKGESAIPRLTNPMETSSTNPFDLVKPVVEQKDKKLADGELKIPVPSVNNPSLPPITPVPNVPAPEIKNEQPEKQAAAVQKNAEKEAALQGMIANALTAWVPSGQLMEFNHVGKGQSGPGGQNSNGIPIQGGVPGVPGVAGVTGVTGFPVQGGGSGAQAGGQMPVAQGAPASSGNQKAASVKTGTIYSAIVLTSVNSDEPGPVLAQIVSGPYSGARVIGSFSRGNNAEKLSLQFNTISLPNAPSSYSISAFAIDPDTARTAIASNVDNHYFYRYGSLFASSFLSGYAQAISQSGATQTTSVGPDGLNSTTTYPTLNTKEKALIALGEFGSAVGGAVGEGFSRPPTITLNSGVSFGLLFMSDASFN